MYPDALRRGIIDLCGRNADIRYYPRYARVCAQYDGNSNGAIVLFIVKTVRRFGVLMLLAGLGVALFTLTGMGSINCLIFVVIAGLIADVIIAKTGFKTFSIGIGHGLTQAAYFAGGAFPFLFFLERKLSKWQKMGISLEEMHEYVQYFTGAFAVIGIVSAIVFGIVGIYIGKLILKRHFKDME